MNSIRYGKFFVGMFLLIAATAVFRWGLLKNVQFEYMDEEFPWWKQAMDYIHTKGDKPEILFLGDSRMEIGIIPDKICVNACNLGLGGSTALEAYYVLKKYLEKHPKPEKVFMGFAGIHFQMDEWVLERRSIYFDFLSFQDVFEAYLINYKLGVLDYDEVREKIDNMLKYKLLFPQKYSAACINSKFKRGEYNRSAYNAVKETKGYRFSIDTEKDAGLSAGLSYELTDAEGRNGFHVLPRIEYYFHEIINLCKEEGIPLFIVQPPMNEPSWKKISENGYYAGLQKWFSALSEEAGIPVETDIPCYPIEFFGDPNHVNPRGAERFSSEIKAKYKL